MGIVRGICMSERRGTKKQPVDCARLIEEWGLAGDAHAGHWHRQVSLLSLEKIEAFRREGAEVAYGDFGENLIIEGCDLRALPVGTVLGIGDARLQITQIGKECHSHCAIYAQMGDCIMPREGVFARVRKGGEIRVGDTITILEDALAADGRLTAAVITLSDKGAAGGREDISGPLLKEMLEEAGFFVVESLLLPDDQDKIERELIRLADTRKVNLILTTGGTGFAARDVTPEATLAVATRNAPGIAEAIRAASMKITPRAMLSREASVIRNETLIINLPGSPKAVRECFDVIGGQLAHGIGILTGREGECGSSAKCSMEGKNRLSKSFRLADSESL